MRIVKWAFMIALSIGVGTFIELNILEKLGMNVWLARGIGCLVTVIIGLILHRLFFGKKTSE